MRAVSSSSDRNSTRCLLAGISLYFLQRAIGPDRKCPLWSSGERLQSHLLAERFELADEAADGALRVEELEVVAARVAVELAGCEHVPAGDGDRVLDGAERAPVTATRA